MLAPPSQLRPARSRQSGAGQNGYALELEHLLGTQQPAPFQGKRKRNQLIEAYRPLVRSIVRKEFGGFPHLRDDLEQAGSVGLVKAAVNFNPEVYPYFGLYARVCIRNEILDELRLIEGAVKRPTAVALGGDVSLNEPAYREADDDGNTKLDLVVAEPADTTELEVAALRSRLYDQWATDLLSLREAQIIHDRYLIEDPKTLQQVGAMFGISAERVRQIEARALGKLADAISKGRCWSNHDIAQSFVDLTQRRLEDCPPKLLRRHRQPKDGARLLLSLGLPKWSGEPRADEPTRQEINAKAAYDATFADRLSSWERVVEGLRPNGTAEASSPLPATDKWGKLLHPWFHTRWWCDGGHPRDERGWKALGNDGVFYHRRVPRGG
jgi:RNA polymerase sigma factor (sigma-70 family)